MARGDDAPSRRACSPRGTPSAYGARVLCRLGPTSWLLLVTPLLLLRKVFSLLFLQPAAVSVVVQTLFHCKLRLFLLLCERLFLLLL